MKLRWCAGAETTGTDGRTRRGRAGRPARCSAVMATIMVSMANMPMTSISPLAAENSETAGQLIKASTPNAQLPTPKADVSVGSGWRWALGVGRFEPTLVSW
ncbi:hypothetical protein BH24ACI4_BH24ACI4_24510 [soil metagenome]